MIEWATIVLKSSSYRRASSGRHTLVHKNILCAIEQSKSELVTVAIRFNPLTLSPVRRVKSLIPIMCMIYSLDHTFFQACSEDSML